MKKIFLILLIIVLSISVVAAAYPKVINVKFKGKWQENTTLYSKTYSVNNATLYGNDTYPNRNSLTVREKVCYETYKEKRKRVCNTEIVGYKNRTKRKCYRENHIRVCNTTTYQVPIKKRVCHILKYNDTYIKCRYVTSPNKDTGCLNPDGQFTNSLKLENFKYSIDNTTWQDIPYQSEAVQITSDVIFKLDIPATCSPKYKYNKAITIIKYS